jgi:hypothetical protein
MAQPHGCQSVRKGRTRHARLTAPVGVRADAVGRQFGARVPVPALSGQAQSSAEVVQPDGPSLEQTTAVDGSGRSGGATHPKKIGAESPAIPDVSFRVWTQAISAAGTREYILSKLMETCSQ